MQLKVQKYVCPCCGYPELSSPPYEHLGPPPWLDHGPPPYQERYGSPSYECCACCGFEYGCDDDPGAYARPSSFREYLTEWIAEGCIWLDPILKPDEWSLDDQLRQASIPHDANLT